MRRRLARRRPTRLRATFSLGHDGGHLTRGHDRRLRGHELQDAVTQALGQTLEPRNPPIRGRPGHLEEPGQSRAAIARPRVQIDGQDPALVLEDDLPDRGVIGLGEVGEPVLELLLKDLRLDLHAVPVAAIEFDQGPKRSPAGVLGEREHGPEKLGLPVDVLEPVTDVGQRERLLKKHAPGFSLAE